MFRPLRHTLDRIVARGSLRLIDADSCAHDFGDGSGSPVVARIADRATERQFILNPALAIGEAYMDGRLVLEQGTIYDFLEFVFANLDYPSWPRLARVREELRFVRRGLRQCRAPLRSRWPPL